MRKFIKALAVILLITSPFSIHAKAETMLDINDLIEKAKELDGQEVTIRGEAIGECMERGDYAWININDGTNAIGIWLSKSEAAKIHYYGNYKNIGDTIELTGTFHRACKEHGGEADVHCDSIQISKEGYPVKEQIAPIKFIGTGLSAIFALALLLIYNKIKKARNL